ncbi:hypothetical protein TWF225_003192 [Orbilia oligospora]|nr:hypothetical protein TWF225_003192 [Orbilia oligospora]KAF3263045.1 hypothetical protein TWF128_002018 [Orbilia oligospora]KAF3267417.1 hypothetical protein TWF217_000480 [Orbilia oligospora]
MIDVIVKADRYGEKQAGALRWSTPIWYWDFGSVELNEVNGGTQYHSLIQIAGGPETDTGPGITNSLEPEEDLLYATLKKDVIFRSFFKVKRDGQYLHLKDEDGLNPGDVLEFWGPSRLGQNKLFLNVFGPETFGLRRIPYSEDPSVSLEVELRVRVATASNTKIGSRSEGERLAARSPINRSISLSFGEKNGSGCLSRVCKATASGIGGLFRGAKKIFSGASKGHRKSGFPPQDPRRFLDDLALDDRLGTGRVRLRGSVSRQLTQNSEPSARSPSAHRQSNNGELELPEALTVVNDRGTATDLPRFLNLGPRGARRLLNYIVSNDLDRITEGTEGTGIDTPIEIRTPGIIDTRPILNTMTNSRPDTHGHFGSEILMSPKNPEIAENPEEEEDEADEEERKINGDYEYRKEAKEEEEADTSSLSIAISEDIDDNEDVQVNNPPMLLTGEGGPGASKGVLDLSRITSTHTSQPVPAEKQLRRSNNLMGSYSEELE